ncbi:MAG: hypothetical protein II306_10030 [Clostridia bacterium]|nr:hypothetical protein [Clostridia bacterium]
MKEYFDFGQRVIKIIRDVDFSILKDGEIDDNDMVKMMFEPKHGTVIYIAGMFEDNEDCLLCMGAEDGSTKFKVAYYEHFREFQKEWYRITGNAELLSEIEETEKAAKEIQKNRRK